MFRSCINFSERERGGHRIRTLYSIISLMLIFSGIAFANDSKPLCAVNASVDKDSVHIGENLTYTIEVKTEKDTVIDFPAFTEDAAGGLAVRDSGSSESGFLWTDRTVSRWYVLYSYEPGTFTIPGAAIRCRKDGEEKWHETVSGEISIEVLSMLDDTDKRADIREIRPPVDVSSVMYVYILSAIAAVFVIVMLIMFLKRRKGKTEKSVPPPPAHETAFRALKELKEKDYISTGKIREYYFELSDIVRHYLEQRFHLRAPEMTTEEFLLSAGNTNVLNPEHKGLLGEFLTACDMVKFAKYDPDRKEIESSYETAYRLVEQTKKRTEDMEDK